LERHKLGIVCVKFKLSSEAEECIRVMDGRYFAGRTVEASFYDGRTDLRALGSPIAAVQVAEATAVEAAAAAASCAVERRQNSGPALAPSGTAGGGNGTAECATPAEEPSSGAGNMAGSVASLIMASTEAKEEEEDKAHRAAEDEPEKGPASIPVTPQLAAIGKSWDEWLDDQSSGSDEEFRVRVEE